MQTRLEGLDLVGDAISPRASEGGGRMVKLHLDGIMNAVVLRATNAAAESINSRIQKVKRMANGFRDRERFRNAIYFHLGGLEIHP